VRRRVTLLVAAITSAVILACLAPLALLLRTLAEDRAIAAATSQSQTLLSVAATAQGTGSIERHAAIERQVETLVGDQPAGVLSLYLPGEYIVGPQVDDRGVDQARRQNRSWTRRGNPTVVYVVSSAPDQSTLVARAEIGESRLHRGVQRALVIVGVLGLLLLVVAVVIADQVARRMTASLRTIAAAADRMREGSLEGAVPEEGPKEAVAVAAALNWLGERVRQLVASERDAVADHSHRLRTPVTALRLDTEFVEDPDVAERLRGHVSQLERTVDAIVHDARRPSRSGQLTAASSDVGKVVGERVSFWSALAEDQGRPLRLALPDRPLRARLSANDLADVVDVLIDNVFAHTDEGTPVEIWVVPRADGAVVLTVEDAGLGLPSVDVLNRGKSNAGSTGLGLDIVRRAALASGGSLELGRSRLGGALVRLVLGRADD
jgi:signal transduction histidine kinase